MLDGKLWMPEVAKATHYHAYWVHPDWVGEMKKIYKLGVHAFYRPLTWGDGSDEPTWGDAKATEAEAAKEEQGVAGQPQPGMAAVGGGAGVYARKARANSASRASHARRKWLGSRKFVLVRPAGVYRVRARPMRPERFRQWRCREQTIESATGVGWRTPLVVVICGCADRGDQLWAALLARFLPHAAVAGQSLGPRRLCLRHRHSEFAVGHRPAVRRRHRRPLRRAQGAGRRRGLLCARPGGHGAFHHARRTDVVGRRADRVRPLRLRFHHRGRRVRQAGAAGVAVHRLRRRHGGRLVRTVSLFAARRRADGCL